MLGVYRSSPDNTLNSRLKSYFTISGGWLRGISNGTLMCHPHLLSLQPRALAWSNLSGHTHSPGVPPGFLGSLPPHPIALAQLHNRVLAPPPRGCPWPRLQRLLPRSLPSSPQEVALVPLLPHSVFFQHSSQRDAIETQAGHHFLLRASSGFPRGKSPVPQRPLPAWRPHSGRTCLRNPAHCSHLKPVTVKGLSLFFVHCCIPSR